MTNGLQSNASGGPAFTSRFDSAIHISSPSFNRSLALKGLISTGC
jgi:hypothetical protein